MFDAQATPTNMDKYWTLIMYDFKHTVNVCVWIMAHTVADITLFVMCVSVQQCTDNGNCYTEDWKKSQLLEIYFNGGKQIIPLRYETIYEPV